MSLVHTSLWTGPQSGGTVLGAHEIAPPAPFQFHHQAFVVVRKTWTHFRECGENTSYKSFHRLDNLYQVFFALGGGFVVLVLR